MRYEQCGDMCMSEYMLKQEISLLKKQRDLLADVAQNVHCLNCPIYAEGMGCAEVQEGSCYEHLLQWSENKAREAENGER